jgi:putative DNA primase/helicase
MIRHAVEALGAKRVGGGWLARCPAHDDRRPSLSLRIGDNGRLLFHCFSGCSFQEIRDALGGEFPDPTIYTRFDEPEEIARKDCARRIWGESLPASGTVVQCYLRSRAIKLPVPPALRFHPGLKHPTGNFYPAMVAAVVGKTGTLVAIQRTYLRRDGGGKADIDPGKMSLGRCAGGAVRLAAAGEVLCLAEGVETALSVQQAVAVPTWATLGASNLTRVDLPDEVHDVIICADADPTGERAALAAAERFMGQGRRVRIARPPSPYIDFNELLQVGLRWTPEVSQSATL